MKNSRGKVLLLLGAVLAAMAFVAVYVMMSGGLTGPRTMDAAAAPTAEPLVSVAVVNRDLPAYTVLDSTNVATIDMVASTVSTMTTSSPATLYGKMTLVDMSQGQPVMSNLLTETGFSSILKNGEHAFALAVPEKSTFGNAIVPNDRVDVVWTVTMEYDRPKPPDATGAIQYEKGFYTSTKTLIQNIHVLRVIRLEPEVVAGAAPRASEASAEGAPPPSQLTSASMYSDNAGYTTVLVLGVTDQQAEILAYARQNGWVDLTLRSSALQKNEVGETVKDAQGNDVRIDSANETTTGITLDMLVEQYGVISPYGDLPAPTP